MFSKNIKFKNYQIKKKKNISKKIQDNLKLLLKENNAIFQSLGTGYKNNYNKNLILRLKNYSHFRIIGMGGSVLGAESIYNFLQHKVKKKFYFINNLQSNADNFEKKKIPKLNNF